MSLVPRSSTASASKQHVLSTESSKHHALASFITTHITCYQTLRSFLDSMCAFILSSLVLQ